MRCFSWFLFYVCVHHGHGRTKLIIEYSSTRFVFKQWNIHKPKLFANKSYKMHGWTIAIIHVTLYYHDNGASETIEWGQRSYTWIKYIFICCVYLCIILQLQILICKHLQMATFMLDCVLTINNENSIASNGICQCSLHWNATSTCFALCTGAKQMNLCNQRTNFCCYQLFMAISLISISNYRPILAWSQNHLTFIVDPSTSTHFCRSEQRDSMGFVFRCQRPSPTTRRPNKNS